MVKNNLLLVLENIVLFVGFTTSSYPTCTRMNGFRRLLQDVSCKASPPVLGQESGVPAMSYALVTMSRPPTAGTRVLTETLVFNFTFLFMSLLTWTRWEPQTRFMFSFRTLSHQLGSLKREAGALHQQQGHFLLTACCGQDSRGGTERCAAT